MSATKLVIVESPAKAATIEGYLGPDFHVTASIGHIRDLPQPSELPKDMKKGPFGRFALDEYESLMETVYLMQSPANARHLCESIARHRAGEGVVHDLIELDED